MRQNNSMNYSLNSTYRKSKYRPNSAYKRHLKLNTINNENPTPIMLTMPINTKKFSSMGNRIEGEQLLENNMQLKDIISSLKSELSQASKQLAKKELEVRRKEALLQECASVYDNESSHRNMIDTTKESTLISLWRDKYNELKSITDKKVEENRNLKSDIKITKLKECHIQIEILKKEMDKLRTLYISTLNDNERFNILLNKYKNFKNKNLEQQNIIKSLVNQCEQYNQDIKVLKEENQSLVMKLDKNMKTKKLLKNENFNLRNITQKMINQKKEISKNESMDNVPKKSINFLRKEVKEYKKLCGLVNKDFDDLSKQYEKLQNLDIKRKNEQDSIKPFNYNLVKVIQNKKEIDQSDKLDIYKSLVEETKQKIELYENYLKKLGIDKDQLAKSLGYDGIINTQNSNNMMLTDTNTNIENNEEMNKDETIKNENTKYSTSINKNSINTNVDNEKKLSKIEEEERQEDDENNQLMSLLHVFVKNLEANDITKEIINQKMLDIIKIFEDKTEASKEEFIEPFQKMFIETMKITQEDDIKQVNTFFNTFVDSINGDTTLFFNGLSDIFDNLKDYKGINKDMELSFELNKYKNELLNVLKKNDINNDKNITFDILRNIAQEINFQLNDELMEYLIYLMKKNVKENNSIFTLNYGIIEQLLEKNEIGDVFNNIKQYIIDEKINLDDEFNDLINEIYIQGIKLKIIKKENFFNVIEKFNINISEEIKNNIYDIFKIDIDKSKNEEWMEYNRIEEELK